MNTNWNKIFWWLWSFGWVDWICEEAESMIYHWHWFTSVAFLWTFNKIFPKRSLENLTSDDLRSLKLCFYASWLPNCWKNCHLPWGVYSVPKKHPLAHVDLLNFGPKTITEIWSFSNRSWQRSTHCSHKMFSSWSPMFYKQLQM